MRGSPHSADAMRFFYRLEPELLRLQAELESGDYRPGGYRYFTIHEPKERRIAVASFRDRVVHHALVGVLEPIFERSFIFDSYATRKGKGTHRAVARAQRYLRGKRWYLKCDIKGYFASIDHEVLLDLVARKIKDPHVLDLVARIVRNGEPRGLPIGNYSSQFLANVYLDPLDHHVKDMLGFRRYIRYMDDIVVFADDSRSLKRVLAQIESFIERALRLRLKRSACMINTSAHGLGFLGMRIFPSVVRIRRENLARSLSRMKRLDADLAARKIDEEAYQRSVSSICAHIASGDTHRLMQSILRGESS